MVSVASSYHQTVDSNTSGMQNSQMKLLGSPDTNEIKITLNPDILIKVK